MVAVDCDWNDGAADGHDAPVTYWGTGRVAARSPPLLWGPAPHLFLLFGDPRRPCGFLRRPVAPVGPLVVAEDVAVGVAQLADTSVGHPLPITTTTTTTTTTTIIIMDAAVEAEPDALDYSPPRFAFSSSPIRGAFSISRNGSFVFS